MKPSIKAKNSSDALRLQLGAKTAENDAAKRQIATLKAKLEAIEKRIADNNKNLVARFAKFGIAISENPSKAEIEAALVVAEGYAIKTKQLAESMAASMGFTPVTDGQLKAACAK